MFIIDRSEKPVISIYNNTDFPNFSSNPRALRAQWTNLRYKWDRDFGGEQVFPTFLNVLQMEKASAEYYKNKASNFNTTNAYYPPKQVVYLEHARNSPRPELAGYYDQKTDSAAIYIPSGPDQALATALRIHHELGHASGISEVRESTILDAEGYVDNQCFGASGFARIQRNRLRWGAIEEGLVTWDEMDFYNEKLKQEFPRDFSRGEKQKMAQTKKQVKEYFPERYVDSDMFFWRSVEYSKKGYRLNRQVVIKYVLDNAAVYALTRSMAGFLGHQIAEIRGLPDLTIEEKESEGRKCLDSARYKRSNLVHQAIESELGKAGTIIRNLPSWPKAEVALLAQMSQDFLELSQGKAPSENKV